MFSRDNVRRTDCKVEQSLKRQLDKARELQRIAGALDTLSKRRVLYCTSEGDSVVLFVTVAAYN